VRGFISASDGTTRTEIVNGSGVGYFGTATNHPLAFQTNNTERARIDSSGNLLVGATAPYTAAFTGISVQGLTSGTGNLSLGLNKSGTPQILSGDVLGNIYFYGVDNDITAGNNNIGARIASIATTDWTTDGTTSNAALVFYTHGTTSGAPEERARITSGGDLLVGTTTFASGQNGVLLRGTSGGATDEVLQVRTSGTGSKFNTAFYNDNGRVGSIDTNGSSTSFSTSSDYRLKHDIAPMTGALAKVALLKPCTYKWNVNGSDGEGFIAHELAKVVPQCVTGEKDAIDADGKPKYQGIDVSFLVATLTAAIQEQQAIIESLKARLDAANL
jgi:hypothetical protein